MANLEKVVKVTQAQYDTLASGGTVGSYTGLNDNYVYLVEDSNTYITSNGGTIDGGDLFFDEKEIHMIDNHGIYFTGDDGNITVTFNDGYYGSEIIYNDTTYYKILFANGDYPLIYSENDNYLEDFTFTTKMLRIIDTSDTGNLLSISSEEHALFFTEAGGTSYTYTLPTTQGSGVLALTSYVTPNATVPSGTTPTALTNLKIGSNYYSVSSGTATDVQINGTSITSNNVANILTNSAYNSSTNKIATMSDLPTVNNATLTIQQNSTTVSTFTANASSNVTANIITPQVLRYI